MRRKDATKEELDEMWQNICVYWDDLVDKIDNPWTEASFKIEIFKTTLHQKGLRVPGELAGGYANRLNK